MTGLPYENATSGIKALGEAERILRRFGCSNFGTMTDWDRGVLIVQFTWNERRVHIEASWRGYAERWLDENPWSSQRQSTAKEWELKAKDKGEKAVPSIVRDWIKGQVTAIETGMMPFEHAFVGHMLAHDGRRLMDHTLPLLDAPKNDQ